MPNKSYTLDFAIIGAMKAGTTTLHALLSGHPDIAMPRRKETDFFLFEGSHAPRVPAKPGQLRGEACPNYTKRTAFPGVPERLAAASPQCKLIFIARDPVDRAVSQYKHAILSGVSLPQPDELVGTPHYEHLIEVSSYAKQLGPWLKLFPQDKILILSFSELVTHQEHVTSKIAAFLGISDQWPATYAAANRSDDLGRLPLWLFKLRDSSAGRAMNALLPDAFRTWAKAAVGRSNVRVTPVIPPDLKHRLAQDLSSDAARFRKMSMMGFEEWST